MTDGFPIKAPQRAGIAQSFKSPGIERAVDPGPYGGAFRAFQIGFLLYLPFVAIDLIISNVLLAMGMMMVSPMTISLPFKLLLFVTLDGWLKISQGLLLSYQ